MSDIITVSAAQGQGKSTFLRDLSVNSIYSKDIEVYPAKTARSIIDEMGVSLEQIYQDPELLKDFQEKVFERHLNIVEYEKQCQKRFLLVERSFIDIAAFTIINLGRLNQYSDWLDSFVDRCMEAQQFHVKFSIFIPMKIAVIKKDTVRPCNAYYNFAFDSVLLECIKMSGNQIGYLTELDRLVRVEQFDKLLKELI